MVSTQSRVMPGTMDELSSLVKTRAVLDEEDVLAGGVGDRAVLVQENGVVEAAVERFVRGQHAVGVVAAGLGHGRQHGVVELAPAGNGDADAVPERVFPQEAAEAARGDEHAHVALALWLQVDGAAAEEGQGAQVAVVDAVLARHVDGRLAAAASTLNGSFMP